MMHRGALCVCGVGRARGNKIVKSASQPANQATNTPITAMNVATTSPGGTATGKERVGKRVEERLIPEKKTPTLS